MKIGGIQQKENKSQKLYIYIYQERTGRCDSKFWIFNYEFWNQIRHLG